MQFYFNNYYFLVKALSTLSFDSASVQGPTYKSLSNLPGRKRAGSIRSGRFVAPNKNII